MRFSNGDLVRIPHETVETRQPPGKRTLLYLEACHFNYYFVIKIILVTRPETDDVSFMSREEISIV